MTTMSPFPGMDPYLERHWEDIHQSLVTYARDQLQTQLPGDLYARLQERVYLAAEEGPGRGMYPDIRVTETEKDAGLAVALETSVAEPLIVEVEDEPVTESYVEIREAKTGDPVVTVIEFLSPTNKRTGPGRRLYRQKQREMKQGRVSLVEVDLVREGRYCLALPRHRVPPSARNTSAACVWRGWRPKRYELYPLSLRERLPTVRIPLRKSDTDVKLDLQAILDQAYRNGRYGGLLDYRQEPEPALSREDAAWAEQLLRTKRLR